MSGLPTSCACLKGDFQAGAFDRTFLGIDDLSAEVSIDQCGTCGRNWLHYLLDFEGQSRSGRWYRGILGQLREYWAGGDRFGGAVQRRSGPIDVSP